MTNQNPWVVKDEKEVYENAWMKVSHYNVINPSGNDGIYGKVHFKNRAVGIMVLNDDDHTWLVGQYRFVLDQYSWEIPEGGSPYGEDLLDSARRELLEETGLVAGDWQQLLEMHLSNSITDEYAVVFLARDLRQEKPCPEETEQLAIKKLPFSELAKMVEEGIITDAITVAAVQRVQLLKLRGNL